MASGEKDEKSSSTSGLEPHESIFFVLAYLPLFELLSMAQVCTSLRDAIYINDDILPWLQIIVDRSLSYRLTDDILVRLVSDKSKGRLRVLALINCIKITDEGLLRVIALNPRICKLHIPGCTSLSPDGVITAVKLLTKNKHTLESLVISGIYGIQKEDLTTLKSLINPNADQTQQRQAKIFYHDYKKFWIPKQQKTVNRSIDVDICPKCDEVRMVFDCPDQAPCEQKKDRTECKGCEFCIMRCIECGICIVGGTEEELENAACADTLCLQCWLRLPKCNFCNKPYCNQHADQQCRLSGSSGFVCASCHAKFIS